MNAPHVIACPRCGDAVDVSEIEAGIDVACPHCHEPFFAPGSFGPYRLEEKLGAGGAATIYRAVDTRTGQAVALKVLRDHRASDPRWAGPFLREAKVAASLRHPGIVRVLDWGHLDGRPYMAMEVLEGGSLEQRLAGGARLDEADALDLALEVASALRMAASHGLVHRDIKPGNILFGPAGEAKVGDFDLCQAANLAEEGDAPVFGTPFYLPPERLQREPEDARSDMYSLGATLYHVLAGHPPYPEPDPAKIAACHEAGPPPPLREAAPEVSEETARIVDRCLAREPRARFFSYDELLAGLAEAKRLHSLRVPPPAKAAPPQPEEESRWLPRDELPADYRRRSRSKAKGSWLLAVLLLLFFVATVAAAVVFFGQSLNGLSSKGGVPTLDPR